MTDRADQAEGVTEEKPLPRALILRLDSRQAVILNLMASVAGAAMMGDAVVLRATAQSLLRFVRADPANVKAKNQLRDAVGTLAEQIPQELLSEWGMSLLSFNEIRAQSQR